MPFGWKRYPARLYSRRRASFGRRFSYPRRAMWSARRNPVAGRRSYKGASYGSSASATRALRYTNWNARPEELKYLDTNNASYASGTTGSITLINGVAAGSTAITREGRQAFWKSVNVSGWVAPVDATVIGSRNDVYVIWDKQPGAAVPAMTDFFVEAKAGSPMNLNYRERFVIIAHKTYTIGGLTAGAPAVTPTVHAVSINVRLNLRTTFKGDANAIGDIATGAMYLVTLGSEADADGALFKVAVRLRFAER